MLFLRATLASLTIYDQAMHQSHSKSRFITANVNEISSAASVPKAVKAISEAMTEMEKYTCLKFKKRDQETGYILFANRDSKR